MSKTTLAIAWAALALLASAGLIGLTAKDPTETSSGPEIAARPAPARSAAPGADPATAPEVRRLPASAEAVRETPSSRPVAEDRSAVESVESIEEVSPASERVEVAANDEVDEAHEQAIADKVARPIPKWLEAQWARRRAAGTSRPETSSPTRVGLGGAAPSAFDGPEGPAEERPIVTRWTPGETWTVETYYRNMAAPSGDQWSAPLGWAFEVVDRTTLRDEEVFEVRVTLVRPASGDFPPSYFYLTEDRRLVATRSVVREQGEDRTIYVFFDEDPSAAASGHFSIVPFELPPDRGQGRVLGAEATITDSVPATALEVFPRPDRWFGAGASYLEIEFPNRIDGTPIRQLWSESDMTWPATSFTPSRRSYRLQ